ncbi:hypothetical protein [Clostridium paraputrificum]|uniref:hypothetical protein n=1 Tax=Clostridium paraputrificum TaxID=29363 RepID=UPI0004282808|nr:hypothetical protein [Clostridium paraputrificum]
MRREELLNRKEELLKELEVIEAELEALEEQQEGILTLEALEDAIKVYVPKEKEVIVFNEEDLKYVEDNLLVFPENKDTEENKDEGMILSIEALEEAIENYEPIKRTIPCIDAETIKFIEEHLNVNDEVEGEIVEMHGKVEIDKTDYYRAYKNVKPEDNPLLKMSKRELLSPYGAKLLARYGHLLKAA